LTFIVSSEHPSICVCQRFLGPLPAHQRLEAAPLARIHRDDGHVVEAHLVSLQRRPQAALHLQAAQRLGVHPAVEDLVARLA
jgi:hypothetical protein